MPISSATSICVRPSKKRIFRMSRSRSFSLPGFPDRNTLQPLGVKAFFVADLVHDENRIAAVMVDRFEERDRLLDGVQGKDDLFPRQLQLVRDLADGRFLAVATDRASLTCRAL